MLLINSQRPCQDNSDFCFRSLGISIIRINIFNHLSSNFAVRPTAFLHWCNWVPPPLPYFYIPNFSYSKVYERQEISLKSETLCLLNQLKLMEPMRTHGRALPDVKTVLSSSSSFNTSSIPFGLDKKRKHAKVLFLQRKGIFHFEKQFYIKIHHCVSLPCDSLRMNFPFLCLPVDRLGQFLHFLDVQPVLLCNLTSSSFGQEIGNSRVGSSKHAQTITITMTINISITIG